MNNLPTAYELELMGWNFIHARIFAAGKRLDRGGGIHEYNCNCVICQNHMNDKFVDLVIMYAYHIFSDSISFDEYKTRMHVL